MNGYGDIVECIRETDSYLFVVEFEAVREFMSENMSEAMTPAVFNDTLTKLCAENPAIRRPIVSCICRTSASPLPSGEVYVRTDDLLSRFWGALRELNISEEDKLLFHEVELLCEEANEYESCHTYDDAIFDAENEEAVEKGSEVIPSQTDNVSQVPAPVISISPPSQSLELLAAAHIKVSSIQQPSEESSNRMGHYSLSQYEDDFELSESAQLELPIKEMASTIDGNLPMSASPNAGGSTYYDDFELEASILSVKTASIKTPVGNDGIAAPVVVGAGSNSTYDDDFEQSLEASPSPPTQNITESVSVDPFVTQQESRIPAEPAPVKSDRLSTDPDVELIISIPSDGSAKFSTVEPSTAPTADVLHYEPESSAAATDGKPTAIHERTANSTPFSNDEGRPIACPEIGRCDEEDLEFPDLFNLEESTESDLDEVRYDDVDVAGNIATRGTRALRRKTSVERLLIELDPVEGGDSLEPVQAEGASMSLVGVGSSCNSPSEQSWLVKAPEDEQDASMSLPTSCAVTPPRQCSKSQTQIISSSPVIDEQELFDAHCEDIQCDPSQQQLLNCGDNKCNDIGPASLNEKHLMPMEVNEQEGMVATVDSSQSDGARNSDDRHGNYSGGQHLSSLEILNNPSGSSPAEKHEGGPLCLQEPESPGDVSHIEHDQNDRCDYADDFDDWQADAPQSPMEPVIAVSDITPPEPLQRAQGAIGESEPGGSVAVDSADIVDANSDGNGDYHSGNGAEIGKCTDNSDGIMHDERSGGNISISLDYRVEKNCIWQHPSAQSPQTELQTPLIQNLKATNDTSQPADNTPTPVVRPKSAVITSSYDSTSGTERTTILRSRSATQKRFSAAQQYALDTQVGYRLTRKPPIPVEVFAGCKKPDRTASLEQIYNHDLSKPPLKPPLPHDALKTVIKKPPPPKFDENTIITDVQSYFKLVRRKAMATEGALDNLLATWEGQLTDALRNELVRANDSHHTEIRYLLRRNASDHLSPQLLKVLEDAKWSKTHFMYAAPSPADVDHAEHFLSVQRDQITSATKYQISVLEKRHREKIERLKLCLKDPCNFINKLYVHYKAVLKCAVQRAEGAASHHKGAREAMRSCPESQQRVLHNRLASAAVEAMSILTCSHKQVTTVFDEVNLLQDELGSYVEYNFQTTNTINFFPKTLIKHIENYADQSIPTKRKESRIRKRLVSATQKAKRRERVKRKARAHKLGSLAERDDIFSTHVLLHSDDECAKVGPASSGRGVAGGDQEQTNEYDEISQRPRDASRTACSDVEEEGALEYDDADIFDIDFSDDDDMKDTSDEKETHANTVGVTGTVYLKQQSSVQYEDDFVADEESDHVESDGEVRCATKDTRCTDKDNTPGESAGLKATARSVAAQKKRSKKKLLPWNNMPCAQCGRSFRGQGKTIPTLLRTCDEGNEQAHKRGTFISTKVAPATAQETFSSKYLSQQKALRESYGSRRGAEKVFCKWMCAERWNQKHTCLQYRYHTEKLIKIAAGKLK